MKKAYFCFLMISVLLLTACARDISNPSPTATQPTVVTTESLPSEHTTVPTEPAVPFDWSQLKTVRFLFASGAGGWGTILYINPDGSFFGNYHDSEASTGPGYPNGSVAYCDFTGQFDTPVAIDGHSYSLKLKEIQYSHPLGTEEIRDGILYRYVSAYGLSDTEEFLLFLPGTPVAALPEYFQDWFSYDLEGAAVLPFYGLYNVDQEQCFSGCDIVQQILDSVANAEEVELSIEEKLQEAYTQADMNTASYERYQLWDGLLNDLWSVLKQLLDEDSMRQLTNEELAWIQKKEQLVAEAGSEYEGGSLYPAVTNSTAANLTKERVYELLEYLP